MLPNEVLEDICWAVSRRDLEALLLADDAWSCVVSDSFASTGPLRSISCASLNDDGLKCQSRDEEKVAENPKDYGSCLRNTIVYQLAFDCIKGLSAAAIESLKAVKGKYLLEDLQMREYRMNVGAALAVLKDDVFACKKLSYEFDNDLYYDETDEGEGSVRDKENTDVPKTSSSPQEVTAAFFDTNTVRQASCLLLLDLPPCDAELIVEWLHAGNRQLRDMVIRWESCGGDELDAVYLVKILEERFIEATSPQQFEFYAIAEGFQSYKVKDVCLENSCGEYLKVKAIQTCYSDLRIKRIPKDEAS